MGKNIDLIGYNIDKSLDNVKKRDILYIIHLANR